jgi:hypothetical protein
MVSNEEAHHRRNAAEESTTRGAYEDTGHARIPLMNPKKKGFERFVIVARASVT